MRRRSCLLVFFSYCVIYAVQMVTGSGHPKDLVRAPTSRLSASLLSRAPAPGPSPAPAEENDGVKGEKLHPLAACMQTKESACLTCIKQAKELGIDHRCVCHATTVTGTLFLQHHGHHGSTPCVPEVPESFEKGYQASLKACADNDCLQPWKDPALGPTAPPKQNGPWMWNCLPPEKHRDTWEMCQESAPANGMTSWTIKLKNRTTTEETKRTAQHTTAKNRLRLANSTKKQNQSKAWKRMEQTKPKVERPLDDNVQTQHPQAQMEETENDSVQHQPPPRIQEAANNSAQPQPPQHQMEETEPEYPPVEFNPAFTKHFKRQREKWWKSWSKKNQKRIILLERTRGVSKPQTD